VKEVISENYTKNFQMRNSFIFKKGKRGEFHEFEIALNSKVEK